MSLYNGVDELFDTVISAFPSFLLLHPRDVHDSPFDVISSAVPKLTCAGFTIAWLVIVAIPVTVSSVPYICLCAISVAWYEAYSVHSSFISISSFDTYSITASESELVLQPLKFHVVLSYLTSDSISGSVTLAVVEFSILYAFVVIMPCCMYISSQYALYFVSPLSITSSTYKYNDALSLFSNNSYV